MGTRRQTLRIEPWGRDSLRVRVAVDAGRIRDDRPDALLEPGREPADHDIGEKQADPQRRHRGTVRAGGSWNFGAERAKIS